MFLVLFTSSACVWGYISVIIMEGVVIYFCEKGIHLIWGWSFRGLQSNTGLLSNVGVSIIYCYCYNFLKLKVHVQVYGLLCIVLISTEICVGNFNSSSKFSYSTY